METFVIFIIFYEDYPIIVSEDAIDELKYPYHLVFKKWERDSDKVRITPYGSEHEINSDIAYIEPYLVSYIDHETGWRDYDNTHLSTLDSDDYYFNGYTLILDSDIYEEFKGKIDDKREDKGVEYQIYITFEIHIAKYRPIDEIYDLTEEEIERVVTMQSIQASVLEYYYQFNLATQNQEKLCEIAYTVALTVALTAITASLTEGSPAVVVASIIKEPIEEVSKDPIIEAIAKYMTSLLSL